MKATAFPRQMAEIGPTPTVANLFHWVRSARLAGEHDMQAHADLIVAVTAATGLTTDELIELADFLPGRGSKQWNAAARAHAWSALSGRGV